MGITAAELAQMQSDANGLVLDLPCQIQRYTRTPNSSGGATLAWSTIATVNAGMAEPTANQLQNYGYLVGSLAAWQVRFPVGTNVQEQDHLIINGETLEVVKIMTPRSLPILLTALCSEVK
jgi:hypothetical protein